MELTEIKSLESFIFEDVEVAILDENGEDLAPFVKKAVFKTELCPDGTHLRIYFNLKQFFAVPLTAKVNNSDDTWSAFDEQAGLTYVIRRECGPDA